MPRHLSRTHTLTLSLMLLWLWSGTQRKTPVVFSARPRKQKVTRLQLRRSWSGHQLQPPSRRAPSTAPALRQSAENRCCFDGRQWRFCWAGKTVTQRNLKGWWYLAFLLQHPGEDVHVFDLLALTDARLSPDLAGIAGVSDTQLAAQGLHTTRDLEEPSSCDATARAAYRLRLQELLTQEEEATRNNDPGRLAALRTEREFLLSALAEGYGYRPHTRGRGAAAEKARKAVTNRIRDALARIQHTHPLLWQHLFTALRTGTFCTYRPPVPVRWIWTEDHKQTAMAFPLAR